MPISPHIIERLCALTPNELRLGGYLTPVDYNRVHTDEPAYTIEYICPFCGNGSGHDHTGITPYSACGATLYKCHKCGKSFNNIHIIAKYYNLDPKLDFIKVCQEAMTMYGMSYTTSARSGSMVYTNDINKYATSKFKKAKKTQTFVRQNTEADIEKQKMIPIILEDIKQAQENLAEMAPYYDFRGLMCSTLQYFDCGYIGNWTPVQSRLKNRYATPTPRIIIPSGEHYLARLIEKVEDYPEKSRPYIKPKQHMGTKMPFAFDSISTDAPVNFIVEGEIDAMSIWQATDGKVPVVALGGATSDQIFLQLLQEKYLNINKPQPRFVVLFDTDETGLKMAPKLAQKLNDAGFPATYDFFAQKGEPNYGKDANDILCDIDVPFGDPDMFGENFLVRRIQEMTADALKKFKADQEYKDKIAKRLAKIDKELGFIANRDTRYHFAQLRNQPETAERNSQMIQIIKDNLDWKVDKKGRRQYILPSAKNFRNIYYHDPVLSNLFGFEEFKGTTVLLKKPYWRKSPCVNQEWKDLDDSALRIHIRENYDDLAHKLTSDDMFSVIAQERSFNVVKNYLESLPKWDGTVRAETLFIDFLKVPDSRYARMVTYKWLLAAVARIYNPGCNFQAALMLHGHQNIGKSYILEQLGGQWYDALIDDVDDTHAVDAIRNIWICEMKEMAAARKAEINATKSFLERAFDTYRAAYAKRAQTFQRHCVFAITVNDEQPLRDQTGNRRYWILESPLKEFEYVKGLTKEYVKQVRAEILAAYKRLTLTGFDEKILSLPLDFKIKAENVAESFTVNDGLQSEITAFLDTPILPPILWQLLTREERHKFFTQNFIALDESDWDMRRRTLTNPEDQQEFDLAISDQNYTRTITISKQKGYNHSIDENQIAVYGSVLRNEICAVEIYNECFSGTDKRKQIYRINEVLSTLTSWKKVCVQKRNFNGYGNQKRFYRRVSTIVNQ